MRPARVVLAAAIAVACSDSSGPGALVPLSIEGLVATDTVRSRPAAPVVVTVRTSAGLPVAGDSVFFEGLPPDTFPFAASMALSLDSGKHFDRYRTGVTDSSGRVSVLTRMQCYAGTAHLRIRVPSENRDTTVHIELAPGAAVKLRIFPRDTAVFIGKSYRLRGGVLDACGNARPDPVARTALGAGIALHGDSVFGVSVGRVGIVARAGDRFDTVFATPLPPAVLAGFEYFTCTMVTQNLDGSGRMLWLAAPSPSSCAETSWLPGGSVLFSNLSQVLLFAAAPGLPGTYVVGNGLGFGASGGRWNGATSKIYFNSTGPTAYGELYSAGANGQNPTRLLPACAACLDAQPDASPDGGRVVFVRGSTISVLLPASGQVSSLGVSGLYPTWSPDGALIAFIQNGALWVTGTLPGTANAIAPASLSLTGRVAWTPDGRFILASRGYSGLVLIELTTHAVTPVPNAVGTYYALSSPSLRPYP